MCRRILPLCALGLLFLLSAPCVAAPPCVSPDGRHEAKIEKRHGKRCVVRDGVEGRGYEQIVEGSLVFDPDGVRLAYVAQEAAARFLVVVDEVEGSRHDDVALPLVFSPDGQSLAYAAKDEGWWRVLLDETPGPPHYEVFPGTIRFSGDGSRIVYAARDSAGLFVLAGDPSRGFERQGPYTDIMTPALSDDGARLAYAFRRGDLWSMVVDGVEEMIAEGYGKGTPRFSADGRRVAYTALIEGRWFFVLDGEILAPIIGENSERAFVAAIDEAFWSPDLHRLPPGMAYLVAHPYVTFRAMDGRGANAAVLELAPGPHTITLDYVHPLKGSAFDVELPLDIPGPGIHLLTAESRKYGLWKQMVENLGDLDLFLPTTKVGTVSFDTMNLDHLAENYMATLAVSERKESQVLGLLRQRWRPSAVRRVAADVAADMLAKGELDTGRAIPLLTAVVSDTTEDLALRQAIWGKLVDLKLTDAAGGVPAGLSDEGATPSGTSGTE